MAVNRVIQVWESPEAQQAWFDAHVAPSMPPRRGTDPPEYSEPLLTVPQSSALHSNFVVGARKGAVIGVKPRAGPSVTPTRGTNGKGVRARAAQPSTPTASEARRSGKARFWATTRRPRRRPFGASAHALPMPARILRPASCCRGGG